MAIAWGVFFLAKGVLNLWVAFHYSMDTWVTFKTFGSTGLILAFVLAQAVWLSRYIEDEPARAGPPKP